MFGKQIMLQRVYLLLIFYCIRIYCLHENQTLIDEFFKNQVSSKHRPAVPINPEELSEEKLSEGSGTNADFQEDFGLRYDDIINDYSFYRMEHPHSSELLALVRECHQNYHECETKDLPGKIYQLAAKISNQHTALLITDHAKSLFQDILFYINAKSSTAKKFCHILSVLAFSQGETKQV
jgi:hypothetical protein